MIKSQISRWCWNIIFASLLLMLGRVFYDTAYAEVPTVRPVSELVKVEHKSHYYIIYLNRILDIDKDFFGRVHRVIKNRSTGEMIHLGQTEEHHDKGRVNINAIYYFPNDIVIKGEWCLHSIVEWKPDYSLVEKHFLPKPVCFTI